jgi:hypothetical protein
LKHRDPKAVVGAANVVIDLIDKTQLAGNQNKKKKNKTKT